MSARLVGGAAVTFGLLLLALCVPLAGRRPLYDGVVVTQPYMFLHPGPGEAGNPTSFSEVVDVFGGESPILTASTNETPPQASVYGNQGDLVVGPTTTSIKIDLDPVEPPAQPEDGSLAGNVYEISVTDQLGMPVVPTPGGGFSVVLRQPEDISGKATMALFVNGAWRIVDSSDAGSPGFYVGTPPELGIFALIVGARHLSTLPPFSPPPIATVATTVAPSNGRPTDREASTSLPIAREAPSQPSARPTSPPVVTSSTSPTEPSSTSLVVAAGLVLLAVAALAAAIVLPRLLRRG